MPCGNQNDNLGYVNSGRAGISLRTLGGTANGNSGTGMEGGSKLRSKITISKNIEELEKIMKDAYSLS